MVSLRKRYQVLKLRINEAKSDVTSAIWSRFLGYKLWARPGGEIKYGFAKQALQNLKVRVRQLTHHSSGRSMAEIVRALYKKSKKLIFFIDDQIMGATPIEIKKRVVVFREEPCVSV